MHLFLDFGCALQMLFENRLNKIAVCTVTPFRDRKSLGTKTNTSLTQCKQSLSHKTGQPHPTAAKQIVPKTSLDPHLTKCSWGTLILGISTLWKCAAISCIAWQRICQWACIIFSRTRAPLCKGTNHAAINDFAKRFAMFDNCQETISSTTCWFYRDCKI